MHNNDKEQLEQWYNDLVKRVSTRHDHSHSTEVSRAMQTILHIGDLLDKQLAVWDFRRLFGDKRKR